MRRDESRWETTLQQCLKFLQESTANVFRTLAFLPFGSRSSVQRALATLVRDEQLVRIGVGVYARAKPSVLTGAPIPVAPLEVLAPEALALFGVEVFPPKAYRDYNQQKTSQVPSALVLNTVTCPLPAVPR